MCCGFFSAQQYHKAVDLAEIGRITHAVGSIHYAYYDVKNYTNVKLESKSGLI